jgi:chlorobactene glucosyltransferase
MKKRNLLKNLARFLLWSHVISVVGFYLVLWIRSSPPKNNRVKKPVPEPEITKRTASYPLVSIIVPARNEERNIRRCVESLLEQNYPNYEVIVVDDGSTDDTPDVLESILLTHPHRNRLWVQRLRGELPEGWAGKPHAIHMGVQESRGSWLLFTDADTWHAPNTLQSALTAAQNSDSDLYTLGTAQELPGFWEKVMMPMAYLGISMLYPIKKVNDPLSSVAIANGQFILIRRAVYDKLDGYARPELRNTLLDDRDLASIIKQQGFRLKFEDGRDLVRVQMYRGLHDAWQGWRKNAFLGSRGGFAFFLLELIGLPMVAIVPFLLPFMAWITNRFVREKTIALPEVGVATLLELGPLLSYHISIDKELNVPWYYAFAYPLAASFFEGILTESAWRVLRRKGIDWRGRQYYSIRK